MKNEIFLILLTRLSRALSWPWKVQQLLDELASWAHLDISSQFPHKNPPSIFLPHFQFQFEFPHLLTMHTFLDNCNFSWIIIVAEGVISQLFIKLLHSFLASLHSHRWHSVSHSYFCIVFKIGPFFVTFISNNLDSKWQKDILGLETDTIENSFSVTKCKVAFYQERNLCADTVADERLGDKNSGLDLPLIVSSELDWRWSI